AAIGNAKDGGHARCARLAHPTIQSRATGRLRVGQKGLGLLQVRRLKPFRKSIVNPRDQVARIVMPAAAAPHPGEAPCSTKLESLRPLLRGSPHRICQPSLTICPIPGASSETLPLETLCLGLKDANSTLVYKFKGLFHDVKSSIRLTSFKKRLR